MSRLILPDGAVFDYSDDNPANPPVAKSAKPTAKPAPAVAAGSTGTTWGELAKAAAEKTAAADTLEKQADSWENLVNSRSMDRELARYYRQKISEARKSAEDLRKATRYTAEGTVTVPDARFANAGHAGIGKPQSASPKDARTVKPARHASEGREGEDRGDQVANEAEAREYDAKASECERRASDTTLSLPSEYRRDYRNQAVEHREHARRLRAFGRDRSHDVHHA